ncbi:MAG: hypothetical protein IJO74_02660 [Clostridia bacterium]|nr:hypothetical protein [Clostridia bacterium]
MRGEKIFSYVAMSSSFCMFLVALISPLYVAVGGENILGIVFSRIPGMELKITTFDRVSIVTFFFFLTLFFVAHALYEKRKSMKIMSFLSAVYSGVYILILLLVGSYGLVINNFPIISIPIGMVLGAKFFILVPAVYFLLIWCDKSNSPFVRGSSFFHSLSLILIGVIKISEVLLKPFVRVLVFDISVSLYLISLASVTFFMYRKYYDSDE